MEDSKEGLFQFIDCSTCEKTDKEVQGRLLNTGDGPVQEIKQESLHIVDVKSEYHEDSEVASSSLQKESLDTVTEDPLAAHPIKEEAPDIVQVWVKTEEINSEEEDIFKKSYSSSSVEFENSSSGQLSEVSTHTCNECNTEFDTRKMLHKHLKKNSGSKHMCDVCNKFFSQKSNLAKHIKIVHRKIKSYVCNQCNKCFSQKTILKEHKNCVHLGIRNHVCDVCNKSFGRKQALKNHKNHVHILPEFLRHLTKNIV